MNSRRVVLSICLGLTLALGTFVFLDGWRPEVKAAPYTGRASDVGGGQKELCRPTWSAGDTITVCLSGGCDYATVQEAVDAAQDGDVIKVAAGTYAGVNTYGDVSPAVYVQDKVLTIRGGYTTTNWGTSDPVVHPTTLDAEGAGRGFFVMNATVTFEGLRFTDGDATKGETTAGKGGGGYVFNSTATFRDNWFYENDAAQGGGIYLRASNVMFNGNVVSHNLADYGAGIFVNGSIIELGANTISFNTAITNGGGTLIFISDQSTLISNTIAANTAISGGGLYVDKSDVTMINNVVAGNQGDGGGIYVKSANPRLLHTTFAHNEGDSGVHVMGGGNVAIVNSILVSHTVGIVVASDSAASLDATLWHANTSDCSGNVTRENDRYGDPVFVNPSAGDYHIDRTSAARDQGVSVNVTVDLDGERRPRGSGYDIGADEFPDALGVEISAMPERVRPDEWLTYTIRISNFDNLTFTAAITEVLPDQVTPTGVLTWTSQEIVPGLVVWEREIPVTVEPSCNGLLVNTVKVTTEEGESGAASLSIGCYTIYLPLVMRTY